ncbi:RNA polymerase sigma-70 factor, partial [Phocaeicola vulgatus]
SVEFHITKALRELRIQLKDYLPFFIYFLLK